MDINSLYVLEDIYTFPTGEQMMNVYFYSNELADGDAEDLTLAFNNDLLNYILAAQTADILHPLIRAYSLGNPADFYERALISADGLNGGDSFPPFVAVNFTLRTATREVRPGSKRIGGVRMDGTYYNDGVMVDSTEIARWEAIRAAMVTPVTAAGPEYQQVIVKRVREGVPGSYTYRLPTSDAEAVYYPVVAALFNTTLSHQVSRGNLR